MQFRSITCDFFIRFFANHIDHVHTKATNTFIDPEIHHLINRLANLFIFPIQIRLTLAIQVQKILPCLLIQLPSRSTEYRAQSIRFLSIDWITPNIVVTIRIFFIFTCLNEPRVFIRSMIHHQIHNDTDTSFLCFFNQFLQFFHRTEFCHDCLIITDIIAIVIIWRLVHWRKPNHINAQICQIIQSRNNPLQVSNPILI